MTDSQILARCLPYTSVGEPRLAAWIEDLRAVGAANLPGDIIEAGVWRGGCIAAALLICAQYPHQPRRVWAFDTFAGMTPPGPLDLDLHGRPAAECLAADSPGTGTWCHCSHAEFIANLESAGADLTRLEVCQGDILTMSPGFNPPSIAALRIDLDWHHLVAHSLNLFGPHLAPSAPVHIDDYGHWHGARSAADSWAAVHRRRVHMIDYTGARLVPI